MSLSLNDAFATTTGLTEAMSERRLIAGVFAFEAALARAQALEGVIPQAAAQVIAECAEGFTVEPSQIAQDAGRAGALTIPLVKLLIARTRLRDASASGFVHFGATSQDAMDTALVLQLDEACALVDADLARLAAACASLADAHRATIMTGRTLLQPATPVAFGQKAAQWLLAACEDRARLRAAAKDALRIQFGGASGNLGSLGDKGAAVSRRLAALLPLRMGAAADGPVVAPWHTRRGALVNLASSLAIAAGSSAKIARDVSLMAQWDIGEAAEPPEAGRGVSSAMPHKQNPVRCMAAIAAGVRVPHLLATLMSGMVQEHERALGGWQAEWSALPELVKASGGAVSGMADAVAGLVLDTARMRANFDALRGLPLAEMAALALAPAIGREEAHAAVTNACRRVIEGGGSLADELAQEPAALAHLAPDAIARALDPACALGSTSTFIDEALALWRAQADAFTTGETA